MTFNNTVNCDFCLIYLLDNLTLDMIEHMKLPIQLLKMCMSEVNLKLS